MGKLIAAALLAVGCGKVASTAADAHVADALLDAFACSGSGETVCGESTCANLASDEMNCGECGNACVDGTTCSKSHCIDATFSCQNVLLLDPSTPSGTFTHAVDNRTFYCDMTHAGGPMQYDELGFGQYNVAHTGWEIINGTELAGNAAEQAAFIALMNIQAGGLTTIAVWTSSNCCFKTLAGTTVLEFNLNLVYPATTNTTVQQCSPAGGYTAATYGFFMTGTNLYSTATTAADFFTTHPVSDTAAGCTDSNNPGMFWRRHQ
jgi:hypothetical protein